MLTEEILKHPTSILTEVQRSQYFERGFLVLPDYVPHEWLARLRAAMGECMERSKALAQSDKIYVLEDGHSAERPRLHRIASPQDQHPAFWEFTIDPIMVDLAADVVGPDVKFHHSKLNLKSEKGTRPFKWHQDAPGQPHTDYSPVTIGIYIDGCAPEQGPLSFIRGSNHGRLYSEYDDEGRFVVAIRDEELAWVKPELIERAVGGPGTVVLINFRVVHGSSVNRSDRARPLLLSVYSSADSFAYTPAPLPSPHSGDIVRGKPARFASFDPRPCELPPDFRAGYKMPWTMMKQSEDLAHVSAAY